MFEVNDKVELTAARGGWQGYVATLYNAPDGGTMYEVVSPKGAFEGRQIAIEADIAQEVTPASFDVGDTVIVGRHSGTIQTDNGDGTYDVEVSETLNRHLTVTRRHVVLLWILATENGG